MKIGIGGDHAGFEFKEKLVQYLKKQGHTIVDFGPLSDDSVDYPDHVHPLAQALGRKDVELGVLICGSGNGVCMTANKYKDVRAALCWNVELAQLARQHNNANVLCLPARFIEYSLAEEMTDMFLKTEFEGGRHERRVSKINGQ